MIKGDKFTLKLIDIATHFKIFGNVAFVDLINCH